VNEPRDTNGHHKGMKIQMMMHFDADVAVMLRERAAIEGTSVSRLLNMAMRAYLTESVHVGAPVADLTRHKRALTRIISAFSIVLETLDDPKKPLTPGLLGAEFRRAHGEIKEGARYLGVRSGRPNDLTNVYCAYEVRHMAGNANSNGKQRNAHEACNHE
jgi:hypothetical protein